MIRWAVILAVAGCSQSNPGRTDAGGDANVQPSDAESDAGLCAELSPVATGLACPASCPRIECHCGPGDWRNYFPPCTEHGCVNGVRCETVCSSNANVCKEPVAYWPTLEAGALATTDGSSAWSMRFLPDGDVIGLGLFKNGVNVGGSVLTATGYEALMFRLHRDGTAVWVRAFDTSLIPTDVRLAANGDPIVAFWHRGDSTDLGNGVTVPAVTDEAIGLARFDGNGVAQWASVLGHGSMIGRAPQLAVGDADLAVIQVEPIGDATFGTQLTTGAGSHWTTAVVAADGTGAFRWVRRYSNSSSDVHARGIAVTSSGAVVTSMVSWTPTDFGAGPQVGAVLVRLAADGSLQFSQQSTYTSDLVAVSDDVIVLGSTATGALIARIDPTGAAVWSTPLHVEQVDGELLAHTAVDASGALTFCMRAVNLEIEGHDFSGIQGYTFVGQLDAGGHYVRGRMFGGDDYHVYRASVDVASDGAAVIAGWIYDGEFKPDFGAGPWTLGAEVESLGFYAILTP